MRKVIPLVAVALIAFAGCSTPKPEGQIVQVKAKEYAFDPATIEAKAGAVTFELQNTGAEEHEFEIFEGDKALDEIEGLTPGLTRSLTVTLKAGTYTYVCKLEDHEQRGMTGQLTVV